MKTVLTIAFVLIILAINVTNTVNAHDVPAGKIQGQDSATVDSITVTGEGFIDAEPDMLDLRVDLFAIKLTLKEAKAEVDQRYRDALKTIKQYKIADTDIKLTRINSQLEYDWNNQRRSFKGYRVSRNLQISIRDLNVYPELLQSLVNAGISNINNATPRFSDDTAIKEQALTVAVDSAKRKAASLAKQFDRKLGQVAFVSEGNVSLLRPQQPIIARAKSFSAQSASGQTPPPLLLGTQRINASVSVVYRLQ